MKKAIWVLGLTSILGVAQGQSYDERFWITPTLNFHAVDDNKNLESNFGWGFALGKFLSDNWSLDAEYDTARFNGKAANGSIDQYAVGLMGRYHFGEPGSLRPFLGIGAGYIDHDGNRDFTLMDSGDVMGALSVGVRKKINDRSGLMAEIKYRLDGDDSIGSQNSYDDYVFSLGMNFQFGPGGKSSDATTPLVQPSVVDSDGDGVSDQDDRCPGTPAGISVDAYGCELDSDGDGVKDSQDACPNTREGAVVDPRGCEVEVVIELQGVHFDFDKATLKPESIKILDAAVATLSKHGTILVEVAGHTDSVGSDAYNQKLSEKRAQVVKTYLINKGISEDRLTARGYGESSPIADNESDEGRAKNRRTELIIQD